LTRFDGPWHVLYGCGVEAKPHPFGRKQLPHPQLVRLGGSTRMVPFSTLVCSLAAIGITGLYALWLRSRLERAGPEYQLRTRVAYMLWVAATRA
jgi:hypothetical protein